MNKHSVREELRKWWDNDDSRDSEEKFTFAMCAVALLIVLVKILWE